MEYVFYNPRLDYKNAYNLGSYVGGQTTAALYLGEACGPTSELNQGGYYPIQNTETGEVTVKKMADNALRTGQYYDINAGKTIFLEKPTGEFNASQLSNHMTAQEIANLANGGSGLNTLT